MFVDESGQFAPPRLGAPSEYGLVCCVFFRDTTGVRTQIATAAAALRARRAPPVKAKNLDDQDFERICGLVRGSGYVCQAGVFFDADHDSECRRATRDLAGWIDRLRPRSALDITTLAAMRRTEKQLSASVDRNLATYLAQILYLLRDVSSWFRKNRMFPDLDVTFDEKMLPEDRDLAGFLPRFAVATVFRESFETRLSALWDETAPTRGAVSTDDACDGLLIADAVTYAFGCVQRGQDPDGRCARRIARCSRPHD